MFILKIFQLVGNFANIPKFKNLRNLKESCPEHFKNGYTTCAILLARLLTLMFQIKLSETVILDPGLHSYVTG